ncbi:ribonucleases P/MRP protein subunit POP1-like [Macrosteles quadrilineatus]|uniref:ribonucleases P/MRP protein subunit POP1-like n=1 Tax=Macrosteles quadrilineatus TaxID=74068 RepID=UPI0023E2AEAC|nr:ribonucleases P/MRP protein subunit POP1-like [Macrosteles quadrilineatus]
MSSSTPGVEMKAPREQYDELLGGQTCLPSRVSILHFANARSQEISALTEAIEDPQNKHLAFQRMPRHLRRRAMSHNVKRMPRRLRDVHLAQLEKSGLPVKGKRPSRKFRRRPSNLLQEYNRRQRKYAWLETHIWHAKRFHMLERWGYKLPNYPNDKAYRACYRATAKHCLIQDMSYLNCIELKGSEEDILNGLRQLTSTECGLTFAAKATLRGTKEGSVMTFKHGAYPFHAIGRVNFMWRPEVTENSQTIWIWCHPAFYKEFLEELILVFQFQSVENDQMEPNETEKKAINVEMIKLQTKNVGRLPKYTNKTVVMTLLKDTLNRFRLTGPLAQVVLTEALRFVDIDKFIGEDENKMEVDSGKLRSFWLKEFYSEMNLGSLRQQKTFWEQVLKDVNSADELPPRMILAATVMDPRLSMPSSRTKAVNLEVTSVHATVPAALSSQSPLWVTEMRDCVSHSKMAIAELNNLRSRAVVPGISTVEWLGQQHVSHLPVLLVQIPGDRDVRRGYSCGWDVIAPAGWGAPLWLGLVHRGAWAGGLRDTERLTLETASGPILPPDTAAGQSLAQLRRTQLQDKHFRLPPDKRPNYVKLGVVTPFYSPWTILLQDWSSSTENTSFYVIRNRLQLQYLNCLLNKTKPVTTCSFSDNDISCGIVQVSVEMSGRGLIKECALICAANKKDMKLTKDKSGRGPVEPLREDKNEERRKTERDNHLKKLKCLRRKRLKAKRQLEDKGIFLSKEKTKKRPTEAIVAEQAELMRELWLPSEIKSVKCSSSRSIVGFVTSGGSSFTRALSTVGYGFVSLSALLSVMEKNNLFLLRNVSSLQYYFVRLKIIF